MPYGNQCKRNRLSPALTMLTSAYPFDGPESEKKALRWMLTKLQRTPEHLVEGQSSEIGKLRGEIEGRLSDLDEPSARRIDAWYKNLWGRFIFSVCGTRTGEGGPRWTPPFQWRDWERERAARLKLGFSKLHLHAVIPRGGGSAIHYYSGPPGAIRWTLVPIRQKGQTYFLGKAPVSEIDAICSVPQLPEEMGAEESARRVLDKDREEQQWQRRLDGPRVSEIAEFIQHPENIMTSAVIIYAPKCASITQEKEGVFSVDFSKFLIDRSGEWTDHKDGVDQRPMWLIDGQHRIRGLAQSAAGIELEVPIILFPPDFDITRSAKIFAEINTLQSPLTALHTIFMQHRFQIPNHVDHRDFRRWDKGDDSTWDSRANHLSYECAAYLNSHMGGPLFGRIKFLDQNRGRKVYISQAHQWVDFSRSWFLGDGPYGEKSTDSQASINVEVENFFQAVVSTCNHGEWRDGEERWSNSWNKALLQHQGPSQALLKLYPTVWDEARLRTKESPIPIEAFRKVLLPLKWVDWTNKDLLDNFDVSGENGRSALRIWMENAIIHGKCYPRKVVMAKDIHSLPGKGILSRPGRPKVGFLVATRWPTPGRPVRLRSTRPVNSLPTPSWTVYDSRGRDRTSPEARTVTEEEHSDFELGFEEFMASERRLEIRVDWSNAIGDEGRTVTLRHR